MIIMTHTSVDPWTVMIHLHDTSVTSPTMMRPRSLVSLTLTTELELMRGPDLVRDPVEGQEPGPMAEGAGEVVQGEAGEHGEQEREDETPGGLGGGP